MMEIFYFRSGTTAEKEGCYVAPDGWYERDSKGLRYLGESILEPMPTEVQAGAEPDSRAEAATEKPEKDSRPSQNQTVSSGVEGAHEGTTADKSEPEKLNNAQNEKCFICGESTNALGGNPSEWPIRLPFANGNGKSRTYCTKCVVVALAESSLSQNAPACTATEHTDSCKKTGECDRADDYDTGVKERPESSLSSPPHKCRYCPSRLGAHHSNNCSFWGQVLPSECFLETTFPQAPSLSQLGAESAHSGKQNTADKSELLPTQLPKDDL